MKLTFLCPRERYIMGYRSETSLQIQESKVAIIDRFLPIFRGLPIFQGGCQYFRGVANISGGCQYFRGVANISGGCQYFRGVANISVGGGT